MVMDHESGYNMGMFVYVRKNVTNTTTGSC